MASSLSLWLVYALGGGFGHLTRACALARAASSVARVRILTNSHHVNSVTNALPELDIVALDPAMTVADARPEIARVIGSSGASCLIVDTFPRGLAGELVSVFSGPRVLVQRDLNPAYSAAYRLTEYVSGTYDLVLAPGDTAVDCLGPFPQTRATAPWLVRLRHELLTCDRARDALRLHDPKPCVLICAAGNPDELEWYGAVAANLVAAAPDCDVRCVSPLRPLACPSACWIPYWPAMDLYAAADVVVGSAGYNTIYECLACGVPLVARPWPRKYDRQSLRAIRAATRGSVVSVMEPGEAVAAALQMIAAAPRNVRAQNFLNGVTDAVESIDQVASQPKYRG